ncbi:MAG: hypothetical protein FWB82_05730 [Treponema sp.]|nr:hypothetical protein [Treponema sp.]
MPKNLIGGILNNVGNSAARAANQAVTRASRDISNVAARQATQAVKGLTSKKKGEDKADDAKAESGDSWACACGVSNTGKFCGECGKPQPAETVCSCGWIRPAGSTVKFCGECGSKFE